MITIIHRRNGNTSSNAITEFIQNSNYSNILNLNKLLVENLVNQDTTNYDCLLWNNYLDDQLNEKYIEQIVNLNIPIIIVCNWIDYWINLLLLKPQTNYLKVI